MICYIALGDRNITWHEVPYLSSLWGGHYNTHFTDSERLRNSSKTTLTTQDQLGWSSDPLNHPNLQKNPHAPLTLSHPAPNCFMCPENICMSHDNCSSLRPSCRSAHQSLVASVCVQPCAVRACEPTATGCRLPPWQSAGAAQPGYLLLGKPLAMWQAPWVYLAAGRLLRMAVLILDPDPVCVEEPHGGFLTARSSCFTHALCKLPLRNRDIVEHLWAVFLSVLMKLEKKKSHIFPAAKYFSIFFWLCYEISPAMLVNYSKQNCPVRLNSSHQRAKYFYSCCAVVPLSIQISPWTSLGWWMPRVSSDMVEKGREAHHTTPPSCLALFFCFPVFVLQGSAQLPPLPGSPQGALPPLHWYLRSCVNLISLKSHLLSYILHSKGPSSCSSCRQHHCCHSSAPTPCSALPVDYLIS